MFNPQGNLGIFFIIVGYIEINPDFKIQFIAQTKLNESILISYINDIMFVYFNG